MNRSEQLILQIKPLIFMDLMNKRYKKKVNSPSHIKSFSILGALKNTSGLCLLGGQIGNQGVCVNEEKYRDIRGRNVC